MGKFFIPSMPTLVCALISPAMILVGVDIDTPSIVALGMLMALMGLITFWLDWINFKEDLRLQDEREDLTREIQKASDCVEEYLK